MNYAEAVEALEALNPVGIELNLERIGAALERLGNPQDRFPCIHIAGTNGKGSTAAFSAAILRQAGYRVGLYTSPHLERFSERIRVDGEEIDPDTFVALFEEVAEMVERGGPRLTYFEFATAMAFLHFARIGVDMAVVEVGLGGRLDATNLVHPAVTVITDIGLDHLRHLGPDLASIAREKAGIIKPGVPVVAADGAPEVAAVLRAVAAERGAPILWLGTDLSMAAEAGGGWTYQGPGGTIEGLHPGLSGPHQSRNLTLACAAVHLATADRQPVQPADFRQGVAAARWPGRLERFDIGGVPVTIDGAHNLAGVQALDRALGAADFDREQGILVFGVVADKQGDEMLDLLGRWNTIVLTRPATSRARTPADLLDRARAAATQARVEEDPIEAAHWAVDRARREGRSVMIAGSLYLIGTIRTWLVGQQA